jgi:serine/threonine-protein phosphatase PGAM5
MLVSSESAAWFGSSDMCMASVLSRDGNQNLRRRLMAEWAAGKPPEYVVARHIFLIRHGQYHEQHQEDEKRTLTLLGKQQAKKTGERLASIIQHNNKSAEEQSRVKVFVSSDMTRAKETADIIHKELEEMYIRHNADHPEDTWELFCRSDPDPNLNEGFPVHRIPGPKGFRDLHSNDIDRDFPRIEKAFLKYIGTSKWLDQHFEKSDAKGLLSGELIPEEVATTTTYSPRHNLRTIHEYEIIVGHANVTRYFICRALQIPPESWLRMNLYHCSMSYLVVNTNGSVTARMIGDNGHIPYEDASVDGSTVGFNWE